MATRPDGVRRSGPAARPAGWRTAAAGAADRQAASLRRIPSGCEADSSGLPDGFSCSDSPARSAGRLPSWPSSTRSRSPADRPDRGQAGRDEAGGFGTGNAEQPQARLGELVHGCLIDSFRMPFARPQQPEQAAGHGAERESQRRAEVRRLAVDPSGYRSRGTHLQARRGPGPSGAEGGPAAVPPRRRAAGRRIRRVPVSAVTTSRGGRLDEWCPPGPARPRIAVSVSLRRSCHRIRPPSSALPGRRSGWSCRSGAARCPARASGRRRPGCTGRTAAPG